MIQVNNILFPVDLSENAHLLVEHVSAMAGKFSARLHLLHVVPSFEVPASGELYAGPGYHQAQAEIKELMNQKLAGFGQEHFGEMEDHIAIVTNGHTSREILRYIETQDIDLVVMGTHGRSGLDKIFFGSVAQRVVQNAPVPVMTINPDRLPVKTANL